MLVFVSMIVSCASSLNAVQFLLCLEWHEHTFIIYHLSWFNDRAGLLPPNFCACYYFPMMRSSGQKCFSPILQEVRLYRGSIPFLGSGPKGPMSCRTQGGISRRPSFRTSPPGWPSRPKILTFRPDLSPLSPQISPPGFKSAL